LTVTLKVRIRSAKSERFFVRLRRVYDEEIIQKCGQEFSQCAGTGVCKVVFSYVGLKFFGEDNIF